ncbi:MAG: class II glutamine amidotransferase [Thermoguttaceae bacterium]
MCGIYILPAGMMLTENQIVNLLTRNRDGIGILHVKKRGHIIKRYLKPTPKILIPLTQPVRHTRIIHARYATCGVISMRNIHPFKIDTGYVFHNGVIPGFGNPNESDTACFLRTIEHAEKETVFDALDKLLASRFVFVPVNDTKLVLFGTGWIRNQNSVLCCGMI